MIEITLTEKAIERCRAHATERIKPENVARSRSSLVSATEGASYNFNVQLNGRLCEYAACVACGLDPRQELNWDPGRPDHYDFKLNSIRIDVKGTEHPDARLLIYSVGRTNAGLYDDAQFDVLLMVRNKLPLFEIVGWVDKNTFLLSHFVAPFGHPLAHKLIEGTWYMDVNALLDPYALMGKAGAYINAAGRFIHYCHCGAWGSFGFGVKLREDKLGVWYCSEHGPAHSAGGGR